jgi:ribose transport system permease protein
LGITQAKPFYDIPAEVKAFGQARIGFVPYMSGITLVIIIGLAIFFYYMVAGRQILAVGGNTNAARTSGIPINRTIILAHIISGFLAAVAGLMWMAQLGSAQPMIGSTWLLPSFATPIIGGVALSGGGVTIGGTVLASLLIAVIQNSLVHLQIDPHYVQFLLGLLILGAVGLNQLSKKGSIIGKVKTNEQD